MFILRIFFFSVGGCYVRKKRPEKALRFFSTLVNIVFVPWVAVTSGKSVSTLVNIVFVPWVAVPYGKSFSTHD